MISLFKEVDAHFIAALKRHIDTRLAWSAWHSQVQSVLLLHRYQSGAPIEVLFGELQAQQNVTENVLTFRLDLGQKQNNGLFLDIDVDTVMTFFIWQGMPESLRTEFIHINNTCKPTL